MKRMATVQRSQSWLRKRKMLTVLPLLIIPFLTMGFWALGGGKGGKVAGNRSQGLNLNLPNANLKEDKLSDKLSFYDLAAKDSAKLAEEIQNDPNYQKEKQDIFPASPVNIIAEQTASKYNQSLNTTPYNSSQKKPEDEIMKKVALLQEQMSKSQEAGNRLQVTGYRTQVAGNRSQVPGDTEKLPNIYPQTNTSSSSNIEKLEYMMQSMNNNDSEDPQMNQMSSMLDKILDIQHPERLYKRIKEESLKNKDEVYPVQKLPSLTTISLLDTEKHPEIESGFFGIDDEKTSEDQNAVEGVIDESQVLVDGAVIKIRLANDVYVAGNLITRESFAYGICSLNGERLNVAINSIRSGANIFPVKLEVYDMDGLPGIYIPGAITRDVAKQSADNSLQLMQLSTMDPSLKAQATATGINAMKNLLSKKAKLVKVTVKAGYKVLLKQNESSM